MWFVADMSGVVTHPINSVLVWLRSAGLLARIEAADVTFIGKFITQRAEAGGLVAHVVMFDRVHDVRHWKINLLASTYPHKPPHPRSSSLLAYLEPAEYWHTLIDSWIQ